MSSVLLLVPRTIPSGQERSYSMLFRSRGRASASSSRMKARAISRTRTASMRGGAGSCGSGRMAPVRAKPLVTAVERQPETAGDVAQDDVLALVAQQRIARALAGGELRIDLTDEQVLVKFRGARGYGPVGRDDL